MLKVVSITNDPLQKQTLVLQDGTQIKITLAYIEMQYGWFIRELTYEGFVLRNKRLTDSPNLLHQFRNILPFGLACITKGGREPTQKDDFKSGTSALYILDKEEIVEYTDYLSGTN